ncbi:MAG: hypothetical protein Q8K02_12980 [Flavobacterium sp.]|nr:hypothetical protein [Flavobacterium sp.]
MDVNFQTSFNARNIEPSEIAEKFIFSPSFDRLKNNCHSIILGARGCVKTTLMKMLTLPALYNWNDPKAKEFIEKIPFFAVYIPTDISWILKEDSIKYNKISDAFKESISKFAVNTNVYESLCDTFINILKYELIDQEEDKEIELCINLIDRWELKKSTVPKLPYVKEALMKRRDDVTKIIPKYLLNKSCEVLNQDFFYLDYLTSVPTVVSIFKRIFNLNDSKKFALCFDELEFAPKWLKRDLYECLRSTNQNLLYKLSSSPTLPKEVEDVLKSEYGASVGNDFDPIKMWELQSNNDFPIKIIQSLLSINGKSNNLESYFGSNFRFIKGTETYDVGSHYINEIKELIEKDYSFREFLSNYGIDVNNPLPKTEEQKVSVYRKMKPVVYFRNYFVKEFVVENERPILKPTRKHVDLYSGLEVLLNITDGNPRWLIGLINSILSRSKSSKVDPSVQYDEIIKVSDRFINFIKNTPMNFSHSEDLTMDGFFDLIGKYFQNELLGKKFQSEPISTFTFDLKESPDLELIIEKALLQGALILVGNEKEIYDFEINNKRFKLSYLYYPKYKLPLRMNKQIKLSSIIKESISEEKKSNKDNQPKLFNDYEN